MGALQDATNALSTTAEHWDDVVHLTPRPEISPDEMQAHRDARKAGLPSPLSADQINELKRRRDLARAIAKSPVPEWRQSMNSAMTWLDNLEDGLTTLAYLARVVGFFYKPALLASGLLEGGAMALDWLQALDPLRQLTAVPKRKAEELRNRSPDAKTGRKGPQKPHNGKPPTWTKMLPPKVRKPLEKLWPLLPSIPESLEIAQTTDNVFGVGLSLGPIFGAIEESIWTEYDKGVTRWKKMVESPGIYQGQLVSENQQSPTRIQPIKPGKEFQKLLVTAPCLAPILATASQPLAQRIMITLAGAAQFRTEQLYTIDIDDYLIQKGNEPLQAPRPMRPLTILALEESGCDPYRPGAWPLPGAPEYATPFELAATAATNARALRQHLDSINPWSEASALTGQAVIVATQSLWEMSCTTLDDLEWRDNDLGYWFMRFVHLKLQPAPGADPDPWFKAIDELMYLHNEYGTPLYYDRVKRVLDKHGAQYETL